MASNKSNVSESVRVTIQKAAAIIESTLINHTFIDGNKRTGYVLLRLLLMENDFDITATMEKKYQFVIKIASGKSNFNDIVHWLEQHSVQSKRYR